jgi:hypothetical protein
MHSQESLHHGDGNLGGLKRHHSAIATNDLVVGQHGGALMCDAVVRDRGITHWAGGVHRGLSCLHVFFFLVSNSMVRIKSGSETAFLKFRSTLYLVFKGVPRRYG